MSISKWQLLLKNDFSFCLQVQQNFKRGFLEGTFLRTCQTGRRDQIKCTLKLLKDFALKCHVDFISNSYNDMLLNKIHSDKVLSKKSVRHILLLFSPFCLLNKLSLEKATFCASTNLLKTNFVHKSSHSPTDNRDQNKVEDLVSKCSTDLLLSFKSSCFGDS